MSDKIHKCTSKKCNNLTEMVLCDKCIEELGDFMEENPIGNPIRYIPRKFK